MSLLHQVLRDLQQRQGENAVEKTPIPAYIPPAPTSSSPLLWLILATGLLLMLVVGVRLWFSSQEKSLNPQKSLTPASAAAQFEQAMPLPPIPLAEMTPPGTILQGLRWTEQEQTLFLDLEFAAQAPDLQKILSSEGSLVVKFDGVVPQLETWTVLPDSPLIKIVDLLTQNDLWQLRIQFAQAVRLSAQLQPTQTAGGQRLHFSITPQLIPLAEPELSTLPAPAPATVIEPATSVAPAPQSSLNLKSSTTTRAVLIKHERQPDPLIQAETFYQRGFAAAAGQNIAEAEKLWRQTLRLNPKHEAARKALIEVLLQGQPGAAKKLYHGGLEFLETLAWQKWYARLLLAQQGPVAALEIVDKTPMSASKDADYLALQAGLWLQTSQFRLAQTAYKNLLQQQANHAFYTFGFAVSTDQLLQSAAALEAYEQAVVLELPQNLVQYAQERISALQKISGAQN